MAKAQNGDPKAPKNGTPKPPKAKREKRTPKPLTPLKGEALTKADEIVTACDALVELVKVNSIVPTNHLRSIRKQFNMKFVAVTKARRGSSIERKKERLQRMIQKATDQLEALTK